jgi:hypothetical protein
VPLSPDDAACVAGHRSSRRRPVCVEGGLVRSSSGLARRLRWPRGRCVLFFSAILGRGGDDGSRATSVPGACRRAHDHDADQAGPLAPTPTAAAPMRTDLTSRRAWTSPRTGAARPCICCRTSRRSTTTRPRMAGTTPVVSRGRNRRSSRGVRSTFRRSCSRSSRIRLRWGKSKRSCWKRSRSWNGVSI